MKNHKMKKIKVIITDGGSKHTLGLLRKLSQEYNKTIISSLHKLSTLCFYSKYCDHIITIPNNISEEERKNQLINELINGNYDVLIPVSLKSCSLIYKNASEISKYVHIMYPSWDSFIIASEKEKTMDFADKNNVPIPKTMLITNQNELDNVTHFPVVLKPSGGTGGTVYYSHTKDELLSNYKKIQENNNYNVLCQEYISGFGCGYFGLYANGVRLASFMHKRIKEYPVSGGPSVVAESFYDERLEMYGNTLCEKLNWTGPIMCEFKYDEVHDDFKLIEINPKLWGSLELTLEAGVNIPEMMVEYLLNQNPSPITEYKYVRYRWILSGEFIHFLETRKEQKTKLSEFIKIKPNEITDIRLNDPLATLFLFRTLLVNLMIIFINNHKVHKLRTW